MGVHRLGNDVLQAGARAAARWAAVQARDPRADGLFVYAVRTTGIYCRPVCSARRPLAGNVTFYDRPEQACADGYRPCRLCRPDRVVRLERDGVTVRPAAVLFADLAGFARTTAAWPPERVVAYLGRFQVALAASVIGHGGRVHRWLGDGALALFGADRSAADDAERALACALALRAHVGRALSDFAPAALAVGVHFGPVAFAADGTIGGDTVNVAARLERATRRLCAEVAVGEAVLLALSPARRAGLTRALVPAGRTRLRGVGMRKVWIRPDAGAAVSAPAPSAPRSARRPEPALAA